MSHKSFGTGKERHVVHALTKQGITAQRSAASLSNYDVYAYSPSHIYFISSKSSRRGTLKNDEASRQFEYRIAREIRKLSSLQDTPRIVCPECHHDFTSLVIMKQLWICRGGKWDIVTI